MREDYINTIITLSGDPGSGKSTITRSLKEKYIEKGYKEENIHIIKVGDAFREISEKVLKRKYPDMDITIEQINSNPLFKEERKELDNQLDTYIAQKGKEINSKPRPDDIYIIDSRLAWFNIPNSFAVRLAINDESAGERIFNDPKRGTEDQYTALEEAIEFTKKRKQSEISRYKQIYGIDLEKLENYDLVIDTSYSDISEISDLIIECEELYKKKLEFPKTWASPKIFLPTQRVQDTYEPQPFSSDTVMDIKDSIQKHGYNMRYPIEVKQKGNTIFKTIKEGHHRNFASIMLNKTLIPYIEVGKDDSDTITRKERSSIYDHEDAFKFRYPSYPKCIDDIIQEDDDERDS